MPKSVDAAGANSIQLLVEEVCKLPALCDAHRKHQLSCDIINSTSRYAFVPGLLDLLHAYSALAATASTAAGAGSCFSCCGCCCLTWSGWKTYTL